MRRHVWQYLFIVVLLTSCAAADDVANVRPERGRIELIRDTWGTPHVFAETDAGAMYGMGYAAAEDRAFQMYYSLRIMQGRLAEQVGLAMMPGRQTTAVDHDREMRTLGFCRAAREIVRHLDRESLALRQAYSDGVNDCMAATRDKRHYLSDELGLEPEPWTPADCITSWWHLGQFFAGDGTRELIHYRNTVGGGPEPAGRAVRGAPGRGLACSAPRPEARDLVALGPDDAAAVIQREDITAEWLRATQDFMRRYSPPATRPSADEGPRFSHAWVVGGSRTTTGSAVLISDPQTPVRNPSLFYEFHMMGKSFNARGIGVPGSPIILIGWNQNVAWGMTALGADQADLFRLKTDPQHPDQYFFDGQWLPMIVLRETIKVRGGRDEPLVIRLTHLGPVATAFCFALPGEGEVALKRIPVCENDRETITGAIAMMRAWNTGQFMSALGGWRFPSVNVVFGDVKGDIGFSIAGAIPIRSPLEPLAGAAAMDGTATGLDWQTIVPPDLLPRVISRDDPPAFVMAAWGEDLAALRDPPVPAVINDPHSVWHSVLLAESLRRNGVPVVARLGPQAGKDPAANTAAIVAFLRERLLPSPPGRDSPEKDGPGK
ncbi:MAG: penicillin acylase family protein [Planctomycetota bacterium]|nr:penicillin acylase family protein [Planctomycetota bacterium]